MKWRLVLLLLALQSSVSAAEDAEKTAQAKVIFNSGAQAFTNARFKDAAELFDEAYKLAPLPPILFSMAQAERNQYFLDHDPQFLRRALQHYRAYLAQVPTGGRSREATEALAELGPFEPRIDPTTPGAAPAKSRTRLLISVQTSDALVSLDADPPVAAPLVHDVTPGKHRVRVTAEGHFPEEKDLVAVEGNLVSSELTLRERPALVFIEVEPDTDIAVDGRRLGISPLSGPLTLAAGTHFLALIKNGRRAVSRTLTLSRGQELRLVETLQRTPQRYISVGLLGTGAASMVAGVVFTAMALGEQGTLREIADERARGNIPSSRLADYASALDARDHLRTGALVTYGVGAALLLTGGFLYAIDRPVVERVTSEPGPRPVGWSIAPAFSQGHIGATVVGSF